MLIFKFLPVNLEGSDICLTFAEEKGAPPDLPKGEERNGSPPLVPSHGRTKGKWRMFQFSIFNFSIFK
jgi:hypothetical protein